MSKLSDALKAAAKEAAKEILGAKSAGDALRHRQREEDRQGGQMSEQQEVGRFPMRRMIVVALICAAVAGGIGRFTNGSVEPVQAVELAPVAPNGAPVCDGSVVDRGCAMVEGNEPGPVVALGYSNEAQAKFHCLGGSVITLYRRGLIVGYGCEVTP